jgi:hypothetical protein
MVEIVRLAFPAEADGHAFLLAATAVCLLSLSVVTIATFLVVALELVLDVASELGKDTL